MIFWNALPPTALYEQVACVINKTEQGVAPGETVEQTPRSAVPAFASTHIAYGQKTPLAEQSFAEKSFDGRVAEHFQKIGVEEFISRRANLGGRNNEENVHRRKDRATAVHDVSRNIYFD
jgi:hypothetical protein